MRPAPSTLRARHARARTRRAFARGDEAVSEVIGYVLMLFLSSAVLLLSLQAFMFARTQTEQLQAGNELKIVGARVAALVQQAGVVASEMPNASFEAGLELPQLSGRSYYVNATGCCVWVNTTDGALTSQTNAFNVTALPNLSLVGRVYSGQGYAKVRYHLDPSGVRDITIGV